MKSFVVAKVIIVNEDGKMLALRRSQSDVRRPGQWDFPGGHVDDGEDMRAAARREAFEEAALQLDDMQLVFALSEMTSEHGAGTWLVFVAHTNGSEDIRLSHEHDEFAWMTPQEFLHEAKYDRQIKMITYVMENGLL